MSALGLSENAPPPGRCAPAVDNGGKQGSPDIAAWDGLVKIARFRPPDITPPQLEALALRTRRPAWPRPQWPLERIVGQK
jgi:hypothetical protein